MVVACVVVGLVVKRFVCNLGPLFIVRDCGHGSLVTYCSYPSAVVVKQDGGHLLRTVVELLNLLQEVGILLKDQLLFVRKPRATVRSFVSNLVHLGVAGGQSGAIC